MWMDKLSHYLKTICKPEVEHIEDILMVLKQGLQKAIINAETFSVLENTLNVSHLQVRDIMTPRGQMISIQENMPLNEIIEIINESGHSRFPVISDDDDILGVLHAKDLLNIEKDEDFDLLDMIRRATFVPESRHLDALLADFRINRNHMAIVVDEYGHSIGFVTLEDTIEEIIGEIADEFDVDREDPIKQLSANEYIVKGDTELEIINERFHTNFDNSQMDTIGGLITSLFAYPPKRGQQIEHQNFLFKIVSASSRRIKLLELTDKRSL